MVQLLRERSLSRGEDKRPWSQGTTLAHQTAHPHAKPLAVSGSTAPWRGPRLPHAKIEFFWPQEASLAIDAAATVRRRAAVEDLEAPQGVSFRGR